MYFKKALCLLLSKYIIKYLKFILTNFKCLKKSLYIKNLDHCL